MIPNLGRIGDIIDVKSGYAKNFLIPRKRAIVFSEANYKVFQSKKDEYEKSNSSKVEFASKYKDALEGKRIVIIENASDDGRLYGSVNAKLISGKINQILGESVTSCSEVFLKKPIKEVGLYEAKLKLHSDVDIKISLVVSRSESEVESILKNKDKS